MDLISNDMMGYDNLQCWPITVLESCENRLLHGGGFTDPWNHILDLKLKTPAWESQRVVESTSLLYFQAIQHWGELYSS